MVKNTIQDVLWEEFHNTVLESLVENIAMMIPGLSLFALGYKLFRYGRTAHRVYQASQQNQSDCSWKIWLINEDQQEAGGVYLFASAAELAQYLKSELFASVVNNPAFSNLQTHTFDVVEAASVITNAPLTKTGI